MEKPKVIFLDAVGTLFGIRGSVGKIYSAIASQVGNVEVSAESLDQAFKESFRSQSPPAFPGVPPDQIPQQEFQWWEAIARSTFAQAGVLDQFSDWSDFFTQLYLYFATDKPWFVYPDVLPALQTWRQQDINLGIISNFDTRLYRVLAHLQLAEFFSSLTISSIVGTAKPDRQIFLAALQNYDCTIKQAWHIGDSQKEDYEGAKAVGLKAFWLRR